MDLAPPLNLSKTSKETGPDVPKSHFFKVQDFSDANITAQSLELEQGNDVQISKEQNTARLANSFESSTEQVSTTENDGVNDAALADDNCNGNNVEILLTEHKYNAVSNTVTSSNTQVRVSARSERPSSFSNPLAPATDASEQEGQLPVIDGSLVDETTFEIEQKPITGGAFSMKVGATGGIKMEVEMEEDSHQYKCDKCLKCFERPAQLRLHIKMNHSDKKAGASYDCELCSESFSRTSLLLQHRQTHHKTQEEGGTIPDNSTCNNCGEQLTTYDDYKAHIKMHSKRFQCDQCGMTFTQKSYLTIHCRTHSGEKPFKCELCPATFKQLSHLTTHTRTHTHERPYMCSLCPSRFSQSSSLKRHVRTHTGDKPYKCLQCSSAFTDKRNLTRHMMIHEGKKPFKCTSCDARFTQRIDLLRHDRSHLNIKPFKCNICNRAFSRRNNLVWHQQTHQGQTVQKCALCNIAFSNVVDMRRHLKEHSNSRPLTCDLCGTTVSCRFSLLRHMKSHSDERPYACSQCPATFLMRASLRKHEYRHTGIKPHKCSMCSKSFFESRTLKRHRVAVHGEKRFAQDELLNLKDKSADALLKEMSQEEKPKPKPLLTQDAFDASTMLPQITSNNDPQVSNNITIHSNDLVIPSASHTEENVVLEDGGAQDMASSYATVLVPDGQGVSNQAPTLLLTNPGQLPKAYRLAGNCQNHHSHVLTFLEGNTAQWQTWCYCNPQNLPQDSSTTASTNNNNNNNDDTSGVTNQVQTTQYYPGNTAVSSVTIPQQQSAVMTNTSPGVDCNITVLHETLNTVSYDHHQQQQHQQQPLDHYSYGDQFTDDSPVYTFTSDNEASYLVNPDAGGNHLTNILNRVSHGELPNEQQVIIHESHRELKPVVSLSSEQQQVYLPQDGSNQVKAPPAAVDNAVHKVGEPGTIVSSAEVQQQQQPPLQYSLTVNNPATGNIEITSEPLPPAVAQEFMQIKMKQVKGKKFQCHECGSRFHRSVHLTTHMRRHTKEKPFKCIVCFASFPHNNTLTSHMRSHTGEKPYECDVCKASFAQKSNLTAHKRIHTGEKPYRCDICNMGFRQASHLPTHRRTHSNERPFVCKHCDKRFTQNSALKRHMRTHERNRGPGLACDVCSLQFETDDEYNMHVGSHHAFGFTCVVVGCGKSFRSEKALETHVTNSHEVKPSNSAKDDSPDQEHKPNVKAEDNDQGEFQNRSNVSRRNAVKDKLKPDTKGSELKTTNGQGKITKRRGRKPGPKSKVRALAKSIRPSTSQLKASTSRTSNRIKKSKLKDSDFVTDELSDLEAEYITADAVKSTSSTVSPTTTNKGSSAMDTWCFCEVPHASDEPHTSVQAFEASIQGDATRAAGSVQSKNNQPQQQQQLGYSAQMKSASGGGGGAIGGAGAFTTTAGAVVTEYSNAVFSSSSAGGSVSGVQTASIDVCSAVRGDQQHQQEIYAFIDENGQVVKTSVGQFLDTKEMSALGELVTMSQNVAVSSQDTPATAAACSSSFVETAITNNYSNNSGAASGSSSIQHDQQLQNVHDKNTVSTDSVTSRHQTPQGVVVVSQAAPANLREMVISTSGATIKSAIHNDDCSVTDGAGLNNFHQMVQSSTAGAGGESRLVEMQPMAPSMAGAPGCSTTNTASSSDGRVHVIQEDNRFQILGTVGADGRMQLFNSDHGQIQVMNTSGASALQGVPAPAVTAPLQQQFVSTGAAAQAANSGHLMASNSTALINDATQMLDNSTGNNDSSINTNTSSSIRVMDSGQALLQQQQQQLLQHQQQSLQQEPQLQQQFSSVADAAAATQHQQQQFASHQQQGDRDREQQQQGQQERVLDPGTIFLETAVVLQVQDSGSQQQQQMFSPSQSQVPQPVYAAAPSATNTTTGSTSNGGQYILGIPLTESSSLAAVSSGTGGVVDTNTARKEYACPLCFSPFIQWRAFINHVKKAHPDRHMCPVCYKVFDAQQELAVHTKEKHTMQAPSSSLSLAASTTTSAYAATAATPVPATGAGGQHNQHVCSGCGVRFYSRVSLGRHIKSGNCRSNNDHNVNGNLPNAAESTLASTVLVQPPALVKSGPRTKRKVGAGKSTSKVNKNESKHIYNETTNFNNLCENNIVIDSSNCIDNTNLSSERTNGGENSCIALTTSNIVIESTISIPDVANISHTGTQLKSSDEGGICSIISTGAGISSITSPIAASSCTTATSTSSSRSVSRVMKTSVMAAAAAATSGVPRGRGQQLHQCQFCDERFSSHCDLQRHKLQHTGEKPYRCSQCEATFTRNSSLKNHFRTHSGVKPYVCAVCEESFGHRYQYNKHMAVHNVEQAQSGAGTAGSGK